MIPSRILRLSLTQFRSYHAASVTTRGDLVVLVGANGAGKTNCLEAISLLAAGRGLRRARFEDITNRASDGSWAVAAEVEGAGGLATLGTGIDAPTGEDGSAKRRIRIDREAVASASAFGVHLRMVWLAPAKAGLFSRPVKRQFRCRHPLANALSEARESAFLQAPKRHACGLEKRPKSTIFSIT